MWYLLSLWIELIYVMFKRVSICPFLLVSMGWLWLYCKEWIPLLDMRRKLVYSCFSHVDFSIVDKNLQWKALVNFLQGIQHVSANCLFATVLLVNRSSWICGITLGLHLHTICVIYATFWV